MKRLQQCRQRSRWVRTYVQQHRQQVSAIRHMVGSADWWRWYAMRWAFGKAAIVREARICW